MRTQTVVRASSVRGAAVVLCGLLAFQGCGLDGVDVPELDGPSTFAANLFLTATPDLLVADGQSQSVITAQFLDVNGRAAGNREVFFTIADEDGVFAAIGSLQTSEGPAFAASVRTDGSGIARIVYQAPPRTDATADQTVLIAARPIGTDATAAIYRTVRIELRSAEPRQFPPNPNNAAPACSFVIEVPRGSVCALPPATPTPTPTGSPSVPPTTTPPSTTPLQGVCRNAPVLFQTTSFDSDGVIIRYLWNFGNGRTSDAPDGVAAYSAAGTYTIVHTVTDDDGGQSTCSNTVTVVP
jgi:hypothetical protein